MIRSVIAFVVLICIGFSGFSQDKDSENIATRVNIPGSFLVDIGVNLPIGEPANFDQGFWGSRTLNLYYQYPIRISHSNFSLVPGFGVGLERFKMNNNYTLSSQPGVDGNFELVLADTVTLYPGTDKSMIIANYFDIPLELRFDTQPDNLSRSFNIAVGGRFGVLFDGSTKIRYKQDGETKKIKDKQNHGLNDIRYGFYTRLGIGGLNFFFMYNTSTLFKTDKGPDKTDMNTMTFGISINGF